MTIAENIGFGLKMRGMDKHTIRRRVSDMLELVRPPGVTARQRAAAGPAPTLP